MIEGGLIDIHVRPLIHVLDNVVFPNYAQNPVFPAHQRSTAEHNG
jgi:hypothetical protein